MSQLPKGWASCTPSDLSIDPKNEIVDGPFGSNLKASEYTDEGTPIVRIQNVKRMKFLDKNIKYVTDEKAEFLKRHSFKAGDLLVTKLGEPLGLTCIAPDSLQAGIIVADIVRIRTHREINRKCLAYMLNSEQVIKQINSHIKGSTRARINLSVVRNLGLALPPLAEQQRIVEKLDEVLAQVDTIKARLDSIPAIIKRFRQSVLAAAVSGKLTEEWRGSNNQVPASELLKLVMKDREELYLAEIKEGNKETKRLLGKVKKHNPALPDDELPSSWKWTSFMASMQKVVDCHNKTAPYIEEGIPLIRTPDIRNGKISLSGAMYISQETYDYWSRRCPPRGGDIIFTREAPMGEAGIVPEGVTLCMGQRMMLLRPMNNYIDPKYVLLNILSLSFQERMGGQAIGTGVKHLRVADVESLSYPLAPLDEQKEIVRLVDQYFAFADTIEAQVKKAQARVDNLTQSILAKAFRGELVPQDPEDEPADKLLERIAEARIEAEALAKAAKKARSTKTGAKKRAAKKASA